MTSEKQLAAVKRYNARRLIELAQGLLKCDCSETATVMQNNQPICPRCVRLQSEREADLQMRYERMKKFNVIPKRQREREAQEKLEAEIEQFESYTVGVECGVIVRGHGIYPLLAGGAR